MNFDKPNKANFSSKKRYMRNAEFLISYLSDLKNAIWNFLLLIYLDFVPMQVDMLTFCFCYCYSSYSYLLLLPCLNHQVLLRVHLIFLVMIPDLLLFYDAVVVVAVVLILLFLFFTETVSARNGDHLLVLLAWLFDCLLDCVWSVTLPACCLIWCLL